MPGSASTTVLLTIDVEVSMGGAWADATLSPLDLDTCVWCRRPDGREYGLRVLMDILDAHGLRGVFFVDAAMEALFGPGAFAEVCGCIDGRGHDVQLHLHPAVRTYADRRQAGLPVGSPPSDMMHAYDPRRQREMIEEGAEAIRRAVGHRPVAFRAGNYGAGESTLEALAQAGLAADMSYNLAYASEQCALATARRMNCPRQWDGVAELPVTQLLGRRVPGRGLRPLEINAVSAEEVIHSLRAVRAGGGRAATIVCHSFSLLKGRRKRWEDARPDGVVRRRIERLADFLGEHREEFPTARMADCAGRADWAESITGGEDVWPATTWPMLAARHCGQLASRL